MPLTPKQAAFVAEFVKDGNAAQAAIRAGYPERSARSVGSENLTKPDIIAALQAAQATAVQVVVQRTAEAAGSATWIIEKAVEVVDRALEDNRTLGHATPALALLAKRHPEFRETQAQPSEGGSFVLKGLSDAQLERIIDTVLGEK